MNKMILFHTELYSPRKVQEITECVEQNRKKR